MVGIATGLFVFCIRSVLVMDDRDYFLVNQMSCGLWVTYVFERGRSKIWEENRKKKNYPTAALFFKSKEG